MSGTGSTVESVVTGPADGQVSAVLARGANTVMYVTPVGFVVAVTILAAFVALVWWAGRDR